MQKTLTFQSPDRTYQEYTLIKGRNATLIECNFNGEVTSFRVESPLLQEGCIATSDLNKVHIIFDTLEYDMDKIVVNVARSLKTAY